MPDKIQTNLLDRIKSHEELMRNLAEINFELSDCEKYHSLFDEYFEKYRECEYNPDLKQCSQDFKGYQYYFCIDEESKNLFLKRVPCSHTIAYQEANKIIQNYVHYNFDEDLLKLSINNIKPSDPNFENLKPILKEIMIYLQGKRRKGLFIWGSPGVGKTHILICLANKLASMNKKVAFISMVNLINTMKESFNSSNYNDPQIIKKIMQAEVIFIDDIGGEQISQWSRDDLLFQILNDCINMKKTVFFTSNFNLKQLLEIYSRAKQEDYHSDIAKIKSQRIVDRIRGLALEVQLLGYSRRNADD